jgi:hypothetical protein
VTEAADRHTAPEPGASKQSRRAGAEDRVRAYLEKHPNASVRLIARRCGVADSTASKVKRIVAAEREGVAQ